MKFLKFCKVTTRISVINQSSPHRQLSLLLLLCCILSQQRAADGQQNIASYSFSSGKNEPPVIYINPNPSSRSRTQQQQAHYRQVDGAWLPADHRADQHEQLKQRRSYTGDQSLAGSQSVASSIGKSDQVAEWPFFKSLISSRNNQKNVAGQSGGSAASGQIKRAQNPRISEGPNEAAASASASTTTSTTTTTTTTTTTEAPTTAQPTTETTPTSMPSELTETTTLTYTEAVTVQTPTTTTTTTTTTPAASTTTTANPMNDPLFLPSFHSSLQQAVDRIVKMTSSKANTTEPQSVKPAGLKSSLSLNVLLKNFGVHNLTNLDQILLKSSLSNGQNPKTAPTSPANQQQLSISGVQNVVRKPGLASRLINLNGSPVDIPDEGESLSRAKEPQSAECKIEYTMKHANISLVNESGSDYTCDYIIDRKLTLGNRGKPIDMERVCKLKLRSEFFANETEPSCDGTHLSIGQSKYCYVSTMTAAAAVDSPPTLDRVFEFPINEDAFDVKLVHKQDKESSKLGAAEINLEIKPLADEEDCPSQASPIRVAPASEATPNVEYDVVETMPETQSPIKNMQSSTTSTATTTTTTTTTTTMEPPASATNSDSNESKKIRSSTVEVMAPNQGARNSNDSQKNKKFVLKMAHDNNSSSSSKLHPLNNRFKANPTSDAGPSNKPASHHIHHGGSSEPADKRVQNNRQQPSQQLAARLCDTFKHVSTVGQLMTPEYPNYYQSNTNCSFVIKRASNAYCQLLLHFRDFDLINNNNRQQADLKTEDCPEDYLQIGETRYCNRYAMIGHKMRLKFTDMDNYSIRLLFRSDSMQSGRGFLIKYQQLLCDSEQPSRDKQTAASQQLARPEAAEASTFDEPEAGRSSSKTVAPPLQQPDFSLAMKTSSPKQDPPQWSSRENKETSKFNERTKSSQRQQEQPKQAMSANSIQMQPMASTLSSALSFSSLEPSTPPAARRSSSAHQSERRQCNQVNNELSFLLQSPAATGDSSYENNLQCMYYVRRNSSQVCYLELTFVRFDLEADSECRYDFLEINNVRLCGLLRERTTRIYLFNEPLKVIKFQTDQSGSKSGFLIKVDQLECAPNGSIQRQAKQIGSGENQLLVTAEPPDRRSVQLNPSGSLSSSSSVSNHSQRVFEYDALTITKQAPKQSTPVRALGSDPTSSGFSLASWSSSNSSNSSTSTSCDELLHGPEVVVRSPFWPESYLRPGIEPSACRYTILRNSAIGDKICQIELRFVSLRLGPSDCIEIVGHELLCGFNARNLLRYYQFGESQTHLTIRFVPGDGFKAARTAAAASSYRALGSPDDANTSNLLPTQSRPLRFMLVAKQHECIDGFLSPSMGLDQTNRTNLLYAANSQSDETPNAKQSLATNRTEDGRQQPLDTRPNSESILKYDFSNTLPTLQVNNSRLSSSSSSSSNFNEPAQMKLINRMPLMANQRGQQTSAGQEGERCLIQFSQYNGIVSSASVASKSRRAQRNEDCELKFRLLPGFCRVQLTFGEFELDQRIVGLCLGDYLEIDKFRYCSNELRNTSRVLIAASPLDSFVSMQYVSSSSSSLHGFRAIFKQIECDQVEPTLKPIGSQRVQVEPLPKNTNGLSATAVLQPQLNHTRSLASSSSDSQVLFREIVIRSEFFELNVANLSREINQDRGYGPNMFVVYKIKRVKPEVCKLRLMFYRFDLEPSVGCKRDFLDINNVDRLCGRLEKAEDTRRDYDWSHQAGHMDRDFLISFVSDSSIQGEGILLFGQQLVSDSDCKPPSPSPPTPTTPIKVANSAPGGPSEDSTQRPQAHQQPASMFDEDSATQEKANTNDNNGRTAMMMTIAKEENESSSKPNCYKLFYETQFNIASPNWPQQYSPQTTCYYLIHKSRPDICSVTFNIQSMILDPSSNGDATQCDPSQSDHLDIDGRLHCGLIDSPRLELVEFGRRQFVTVKFVSHIRASGFGFFIEAKQNNCSQADPLTSSARDPMQSVKLAQDQAQPASNSNQGAASINKSQNFELTPPKAHCNELIVDRMSLIESDNFPANYRHNQDCLFVVRRQNQSVCAIELTMDHFDLEPGSSSEGGQCDGDYLEVDYSRFCGSYPAKHRLRFNYFADELDKLIKFHSDAALSRPGFSVTVRQVSDCGAGDQQQDHHREQSSDESGAAAGNNNNNNDEIISYLPDSSTTSTNKQQETAPADNGSEQLQLQLRPGKNETAFTSFVPQTLCQFTYHKERQYLLSPNYNDDKPSYDNNVDCLYRIRAKSYDICSLRLSFVDLELEQSTDCINDYLLLDNRRYCGRHGAQMGPAKVVEMQFSDNLPREIHLLYHTNGHVNEGRGFKILYEQLSCDKQDDQKFQLQNGDMRMDHLLRTEPASSALAGSSGPSERQTRRMRFGSLDYPKNYVSNFDGSNHRSATEKDRETQQAHHGGQRRAAGMKEAPTRPAEEMTIRREIRVDRPKMGGGSVEVRDNY